MATLFGALINRNRYGKKPVVPDLPTLDTQAEQSAAIKGNTANLPAIEDLASKYNTFSLDQTRKMLETIMPGFGNALGKATENTNSLLAGIIPNDVANAVWNSAASRAVGGGYSGTGMGRNLVARDLGTTSLGLMQTGQQNLGQLTSIGNSLTPRFDYSSMFITPQQKLGFDFQQNQDQWNVNWLKNQIMAAPSPAQAALAQGIDEDFNTLRQYIVGMGGMAMGGGGGMGGMMGGGGGAGTSGIGAGGTNFGAMIKSGQWSY